MAEDIEQPTETLAEVGPVHARWRRRRLVMLSLLAGLFLALALAWFSRRDIADNVISSQLESLGLPATYKIESIGADRQVVRDLVIGDPQQPDLTIDRVDVAMESRWGVPWFGRITLVQPRLYGSYRKGRLSFGSLDKILFTGGKEPLRLPDLDLAIIDGRARMDTDFGPAGIKLEGRGRLRGGFAGMAAAIAPRLDVAGCRLARASLYGRISVNGEKPSFAGPLRLAGLDCPQAGLHLAGSAAQVDVRFDPGMDGAEGRMQLRGGALALVGNRMALSHGKLRFALRRNALTAHYELQGQGIETPQAVLASLTLDGVVRAIEGFSRIEVEGEAAGSGLRAGRALDGALAGLRRSGEGTLAAPLASRLREALLREGRESRFSAAYIVRTTGEGSTITVPQATLRGSSGQAVLALSRLQLSTGGPGAPRFEGNFSTGGQDLPRIAGRIEQAKGGGLAARLTMADYRAGEASLAIPELRLARTANGALGLAGQARLSGGLPGGKVTNLVLPLDGKWSPAKGLAMWRKCTPLRFDSLAFAELSLERRSITLCPPAGGAAILRSGPGGLTIAAGAPSLTFTGRLGTTPIRIASGPIGLAVPGRLAVRSLAVELGPEGSVSRYHIADLSARIGKDIAGTFTGTDVRLAAVPLDLLDASGDWRFAGGRLTIANGAFRLEDRQLDDRFQPLVAQDGTLALADSRLTADAILREPASNRAVVRAAIRHDTAAGRGGADLFVDGVSFDKKLQPDTLSRLALGVIANAEGTVRGAGRVDWTPDLVTSTGSFSSDGLDFAAAFGPAKGVSGTVVFTDLIGFVTAPDQRLKIASINPGIEANDGELSYELRPDLLLVVNGASWPFLDGKLTLEPTRMVLGAAEVRRFTMTVSGLDAAKFVQRLELANISTTGIFDGRLPLVFDENGGRIEDGLLVSRPPGGNVSYVGALSYKDLSAMGNFAFDALRSIDYRQMRIDLSGALEGEIITRVSFEGISQGMSAKRNMLTRQVAKLPIRFHVNLRAPFFRLVSSFKSLYDPAMVTDPRVLGLVGHDGKPLNIQPPVSEDRP